MPHADIQAVGVIYQFQELQHVVQVVHRLANAHKYDVGDLLTGIQLGKKHLIQHLRRR